MMHSLSRCQVNVDHALTGSHMCPKSCMPLTRRHLLQRDLHLQRLSEQDRQRPRRV